MGSVTTTLNPAAAVTAGAKWELDLGPLQNSGALVTNVPVGTRLVSFTTIPGWQTPPNQFVTVNSNVTTTVSATYTPNPGWLQVFISPSNAIAAGAQWQVDGADPQRCSTAWSSTTR